MQSYNFNYYSKILRSAANSQCLQGDSRMEYLNRTVTSKEQELPLYIRFFVTDYAQDTIRRPEGMPFWQLLYGVSGTGEFRFGGKRCLLPPGRIALLFPDDSHAYHPVTENWQVHFIGFAGSACLKLLSAMGFTESGVYHQEDPGLCLQHIRAIEAILSSPVPGFQKECSKEMYSFLLDLSSDNVSLFLSPDGDCPNVIQDILHCLDTRYAEDISLPALSEMFHMTPEYLCTIFKEATNETIVRYLTKIRIHHARILLMENPDLTLKEISSRCGFHSSSYFGKVFRQHVGMTPQSYRMS